MGNNNVNVYHSIHQIVQIKKMNENILDRKII